MARYEKTGLGKMFSAKGFIWESLKKDEGKEHVELASGGWVDLTSATRVAQWTARVQNIGNREFALYRTARGALILQDPVERKRVGLAFGMVRTPATLGVGYEYREVSVPEAIAAMTSTGAAKEAKRLFPDEFAEHQVRLDDQER